ncbi:MAG: FecR domain-containing protein [Halopseudomonas sp.]
MAHRNALTHLAAILALLLSAQALAEEPEVIGKVKTVKADAYIVRAGDDIPAQKSQNLHTGDTLKTGETGALGVTLRDGTMLTIGPSSKFQIKEYLFKPLEKKTSLITYMSKGTASYVSGAIAKMNPDSVKIKTPSAYLGLRGTKVLIEVD